MLAGSPGAGVMSGTAPPAALTALFTPGPQFGSWGKAAPDPFAALTPTAPAGGTPGGFNAAHGLSPEGSILMQILDVLRQGGGHAWFGAQSSPANPAGAAGWFLNNQGGLHP